MCWQGVGIGTLGLVLAGCHHAPRPGLHPDPRADGYCTDRNRPAPDQASLWFEARSTTGEPIYEGTLHLNMAGSAASGGTSVVAGRWGLPFSRVQFFALTPGSYRFHVAALGYYPVTDTLTLLVGRCRAVTGLMKPARVVLDEVISAATTSRRHAGGRERTGR